MFFATYFSKGLSEYDRQKLCLTLVGLNILQIHFAIAGFCLGAYISISVNSKAHLVKGYSLKPIGGTISGCSIALFLLHCLGAKFSNDCGYKRTRLRWLNKLFSIVLGYVIMSATILAVLLFCVIENFKLKEALHHGLIHPMHFYPKNKNTKREIDEIQIDYKCCGSSNYTDWFKVKWILDTDLPPESDRLFSRREYLHSVPFSCCDPSVAAPCFHRQVTAKRGEYRYPHHAFFKRGCTRVLLEILQEVLLATPLLILLPFLLELTIATQSRYLQTSLDDCKRRRNPNGVGSCWLFKRCSYETYSQYEEVANDDMPHSFSSSSEELVIYEPVAKKLSIKKELHNLEKPQIKLNKKQTKNDQNDNSKTLLSETVDENGRNLRSKTSSQIKYFSKNKAKEEIHNKRKAREQTNNHQVLNENRPNEK